MKIQKITAYNQQYNQYAQDQKSVKHSSADSFVPSFQGTGALEAKARLFTKLFGRTLEKISKNGERTIIRLNKQGIRTKETTIIPQSNIKLVKKFEKDGESLKLVKKYSKYKNRWINLGCDMYKNGEPVAGFTFSENALLELNQLKNGDYQIITKIMKPKNAEDKIPTVQILPRFLFTNKLKENDAVVFSLKAKDIDKLKARYSKTLEEKGAEKAGFLIIENPNFDSFRAQMKNIESKDYALQHLQIQFNALRKDEISEDYVDLLRNMVKQPPRGLKPDDIVSAVIIKSKTLMEDYLKEFTGKGESKLECSCAEGAETVLNTLRHQTRHAPRDNRFTKNAENYLSFTFQNFFMRNKFNEFISQYKIKNFPKTIEIKKG